MKRFEYTFNTPPYSLHDMPVRFSVRGDSLTLVTEYGMTVTDGSTGWGRLPASAKTNIPAPTGSSS